MHSSAVYLNIGLCLQSFFYCFCRIFGLDVNFTEASIMRRRLNMMI